MEETLQHQATTQCIGLPPAGPGNHRADGPKADHALIIKLDHLGGADQSTTIETVAVFTESTVQVPPDLEIVAHVPGGNVSVSNAITVTCGAQRPKILANPELSSASTIPRLYCVGLSILYHSHAVKGEFCSKCLAQVASCWLDYTTFAANRHGINSSMRLIL